MTDERRRYVVLVEESGGVTEVYGPYTRDEALARREMVKGWIGERGGAHATIAKLEPL